MVHNVFRVFICFIALIVGGISGLNAYVYVNFDKNGGSGRLYIYNPPYSYPNNSGVDNNYSVSGEYQCDSYNNYCWIYDLPYPDSLSKAGYSASGRWCKDNYSGSSNCYYPGEGIEMYNYDSLYLYAEWTCGWGYYEYNNNCYDAGEGYWVPYYNTSFGGVSHYTTYKYRCPVEYPKTGTNTASSYSTCHYTVNTGCPGVEAKVWLGNATGVGVNCNSSTRECYYTGGNFSSSSYISVSGTVPAGYYLDTTQASYVNRCQPVGNYYYSASGSTTRTKCPTVTIEGESIDTVTTGTPAAAKTDCYVPERNYTDGTGTWEFETRCTMN